MDGRDVIMQNAVEQPPKFVGRWVGTYTINVFVVVWVLVVGFGFGGWASMTNFIHQIDTFGLFTKCYQCPPPQGVLPPPPHSFNTTAAPSPHHQPSFNHTHHNLWFGHPMQQHFSWVIKCSPHTASHSMLPCSAWLHCDHVI